MRHKFFNRSVVWGLFAAFSLLLLLLVPEWVDARPGGGHSYSGGGSSGGNGGGEGGAELVYLLFRLFLILPYPLKIVLVILLFVGFFYYHRQGQSNGAAVQQYTQSSGHDNLRVHLHQAANRQKQTDLDALVRLDPQFSEVLFLDFAHSLYHKFYTQIGTPAFQNIQPFLSPAIKGGVQGGTFSTTPRTEVVVANLQITEVGIANDYQQLIVDFYANYSMLQQGKNYRHIVQERWLFVRQSNSQTTHPDAMRDLACPNCGAPNDFNDAGVCTYCDTLIEAGSMTWMVQKIVVQDHQHYRAESLGTYAPEVGTNTPSLHDPFLQQKGAAFIQRHNLSEPSAYWDTFKQQVVQQTFEAMYKAWSNRDHWQSVRHLLSDRLFESNEFWIKLYQEKGYYNRLEQLELEFIDPVKITWDNHYEAITVRLFASSLDFTEDENGRLIGGDKKRPRRFSEYWTFVRKIGVERPEQEFDTSTCPNCGAPADKMSDSAVCGYCGTKTNQGDFTWVLSNIAQDEVYMG